MKIDVSSIVKTNGASLDINYSDVMADLNNLVDDFVFDKPFDFKGNLVNSSGVLKLDGFLKVEYTSKCSRCIKDIKGELNIKVKEDFLSRDEKGDSEVYTYEDNFILIDEILRDNLILNLPIKQICDENCKGFCPKCGVDLNVEECSCKDDEINPQMEILKKFFNN